MLLRLFVLEDLGEAVVHQVEVQALVVPPLVEAGVDLEEEGSNELYVLSSTYYVKPKTYNVQLIF
jgi:hypothetical protein